MQDNGCMQRNFEPLSIGLLAWAARNPRDLPWRKTTDPYQICVAEVMLQQTSATKVAPVYEQFISKYPDAKRLSRARLRSVEAIVHPLGLHYRAARLREMAKAVLKAHGGKMPADRDSLLSLPGVGDYTASALLCFAYGHQVPIIDTNVVRLYTRYFGLKHRLPSSSPNRDIKDIAHRTLPVGKARDYNYAVLDFAAAVCKHYSPACSGCPVRGGCKHWGSGQAKA